MSLFVCSLCVHTGLLRAFLAVHQHRLFDVQGRGADTAGGLVGVALDFQCLLSVSGGLLVWGHIHSLRGGAPDSVLHCVQVLWQSRVQKLTCLFRGERGLHVARSENNFNLLLNTFSYIFLFLRA